MSMKDIVHTLVQRGQGERSPAAGRSKPAQFATAPELRAEMQLAPAAARTMPGALPPTSEIDKLWRGSLTVESRPHMTLKASTSATDEAITDLLIRPFRLAEAGEPAEGAAEFELQEVIGEGGVGVVYAARQASIDRTVAVKMLKQDFAHKRDHRNKFLSEAVVTGELDHPNIVPIYDLGTSQMGSLFYAMKRVRGTPWSEVIGKQGLAENLRILMSVADAIAFSHSRGVIHRDLKPENVMLGDFGEVLVMDWGIALSTSMFVKSDRISQSTSMGGTPAYMAPEMATGPLDKIGPLSDVYLLGAILYEIVSGKPPHTGKDVMSCLYAAARNEIQPTDKSGELHDIAHRAMATAPEDRYAGVREFQAAVREYQSHSESIVLSTRADEELVRARASRDYQDFARALYGFQEAQDLWSGNDHARAGETKTRLDYAATALEKEDYDLGVSLLDEHDPNQAALRKKLVAAQQERSARQARMKGLRSIAAALAATIFLVVTVGLVWIANKNREIEAQRDKLQTQKVELEQTIASRDQANKQLEVKTVELSNQKSELESTNSQLRQAKANADAQTQAAREAQEDEAGASYLAQIGVAAERIANNSFLDAERLLADYDAERSPWTYFRHWEWGHLKRLCELQAGQDQLGARIEVLAQSADAKVSGSGHGGGQGLCLGSELAGKFIDASRCSRASGAGAGHCPSW
jgi:serine/threonine protein kinase